VRRLHRWAEERFLIVVSAQNGTTDELERLARGISTNPNPRTLDLLWSTGEMRSVALLTLHLEEGGMDADRVLILGMVRAILKEDSPIVITDGTDIMVETGLYLQRGLGELHMPIVLTGAMTPLGFENSDGLQNLTESLMAVQLLRPGVYVVMHNRAYPVHRVRKGHSLGRFVWTDEHVK